MGQIVSAAAKPKRCNLSQLSQLGTPAAGEYILVSSDNSMNAAGQGNFDCYIVGVGNVAATALPLHYLADEIPTNGSKNGIQSGAIYDILNGREKNYVDAMRLYTGNLVANTDTIVSDFIPYTSGNSVEWNWGVAANDNNWHLCFYDASKNYILGAYWAAAGNVVGSRTIPASEIAQYAPNAAYVRATFAANGVGSSVSTGGNTWTPQEVFEGLLQRIDDVQNEVSSLVGIKNYIEGKNFNESGTIVDSSYAIMSNKIPAVKGDIVVWTSNNEVDYSKPCFLQEYAADDTKISTPWRSTSDNNPAGTRTLEVDGDNTAYIVATFFDKDGYTPKLIVNGVKKWTRTENGRLSEIEDTLETLIPSDNEHGVIGENYPEQMYDIFTLLNAKLSNRLHFIHVSDNHGNTFGYAENFLDYSPAKFLINTGDLVADKFTDNKNITIEKATAASKPEYLILGNHDYSHATSNQDVFDAFFGDKDTEGTVNYHNSQVGGIVTDKTYYKVDFDDEKVKCIMLDMNDGWSDSELPNIGPSTGGTTDGKMTQTQINWFVSELADAISKNYHVCAFIHTLPFKVDDEKNIANFTDYIGGGMAVESTLTFLADIVDAFIEGGSFNFTYNGNNYTGSFSAKGHFVSWFCGHTHWDIAGKMYNHNNQFMINVCRPFAESYKYQSSYDGDRLGIHWNYVTVDTGTKRLSIYRVGQQDTIYATKRKGFSIIYK